MAIVHKVEISWEALLGAFSCGMPDRVYFLDKYTGEIFYIPFSLDNDEVWEHMDSHHERFLEIPSFDRLLERRLVEDFAASAEDSELKALLNHWLTGAGPFGRLDDILSFFPEEQSRFMEMRDHLVSSRVREWMEANELFTANNMPLMIPA